MNKKIKKKINAFLKRIFEIIQMPEMRILPGNVAFSLTVSIVPIISIIVIIANVFKLPNDVIIIRMGDLIPSNVLNTLLEYMQSSTLDNVLLIIAGIWTASMGSNALILASNQIYKFDDEKYIQRRVKAFIMTFLMIFTVLINLVILVFGNEILLLILRLTNLDNIYFYIFTIFKWPVSIILIFYIIKIIYTVAPDQKIKSKTVNRGAIFTTLVWIISSAIYSFYVTNIANYTRYYGGLTSIIILMLWLYILSYILVLGIAINSHNYEKTKNIFSN